jgi:NADH:ubiquinone oxidoreductase subunit 2 (subunit N)
VIPVSGDLLLLAILAPLPEALRAIGSAWPALHGPIFPALVCLAAALLLLMLEAREGGGAMEVASLLVLLPLAGVVATAPHVEAAWPALAVALVVAVLARHREDLLHSECGIKLLWVMGGALALSWGGLELLAISTGTRTLAEQWAVLRLDLESSIGWSTALSLSLLVGVVMLGGAPFHFWPADLFQGARPWLAPLAVAGIQVCGASWLLSRIQGIEEFPAGERIVHSLLGTAAWVALVAGGVTLMVQRRPERRVGTLASLNGALILASLAAPHSGGLGAVPRDVPLALWAGHLALALAGAATLSRFSAVSAGSPAAGPVLFRRHPWSGILGLYAFFSLAAVPGTPGARLWLDVAGDLVAAKRVGLLLALAVAWLAAFGAAIRQLREAFGVVTPAAPPARSVAWQPRAAMWLTGAVLVGMAVAAVGGGW